MVNWNDPYKVLNTYVSGGVRRSTDGGTRYSYSAVNVALANNERVLFYAPLAGTPRNASVAAQAERVAFGSTRPWISETFGGSWSSIPNSNNTDNLGNTNGFRIRSLAFASYNKLYAGTMNGRVYRYDKSGATWTRTRIDNVGGANGLPLTGPVTDIAPDPSDTSGNSIYITFGGTGDYRHVWRFNGTQWQQRSGPAANNPSSLLDVQANAIAVDPSNTSHIYVGADIGSWRSVDGGVNWTTFSEGMPDAAVIDLKIHDGRRLLRASTHGRGVFERTLDDGAKLGIDLYVRDTQLDQGRFTTVNGLPDPTRKGETVRHWRGPDIKLDTPDANGSYQFALTGTIDFHEGVDKLTDDSRNVATHATSTISTRVYVQVHNRGVTPANGVRVMLLLANASAGLPALPAGYAANVRNGTPINNANWQTIGFDTLNGVWVGFPKIAAFTLTSDKLPPPANLAGNDHHCVLALLHHASDQFTATITSTDNLSKTERKAAHKNLKVVQFTGTVPSPPPVVIPIRINNPNDRTSLIGLLINLFGYPGNVRLFIPRLNTSLAIGNSLEGMSVGRDLADFRQWAGRQRGKIGENQRSAHPYNKLWSDQQLEDIGSALDSDIMLLAGLLWKEAPSLAISILAAELFYKFHSFTLECLAFLATWVVVSWTVNQLERVLRRDAMSPARVRIRPGSAIGSREE